uniref:Ribosomal protein S8 n=1 Tax=Psammoneis japonica TaxID=517775 RepID=A0A2U9GIS4_9STRA|nr:ribosomal protein S8 [Psammoneis japonica]AWQ64266.1 ribosomal protein S8 [Psammoneis japonica]
MFANIRNGQLVKRAFVLQSRKKICEALLSILWDEGFILGYKVLKTDLNMLKIFLKYKNGQPVINSLKVISKPGHRIYYSAKQLWKINSNNSLIIVSTNQGLFSLVECKKLNLGGEPLIAIN